MGTVRLFNQPVSTAFLLLLLAEAGMLAAATYLGVYVRFLSDPASIPQSVGVVWPRALLFTSLFMLSLAATGLYNRRLRDGLEGVLVRLVLGLAFGVILMSLAFYALPDLYLGRGAFALAVVSAFVLLAINRAVFLKLLAQRNIRRRALILGAGKRALPLGMLRRKSDLIGFEVVGYWPTAGDRIVVDSGKLVDTSMGLIKFVETSRIDEIIVAVDDRRQGLPMTELLHCRTRGIEVVDLLTFLERETGKIKLDILYPSWLAFSRGFERGVLRGFVKRSFDILVSLAMLVATAPLIVLTVLAIWGESRFQGPILYRQSRVGEAGRPFSVLKFRSMRTDAESDGKARWAATDDKRVTRVGAIIRKYRIDELPQIINVLRGEMSFVGPRPERPEFVGGLLENLPYYGERHQVKPGLTGWAQICYPYGASEKDAFQKLEYDLYYVKNHSLLLDLTILLQTAEVVLWGKGAR